MRQLAVFFVAISLLLTGVSRPVAGQTVSDPDLFRKSQLAAMQAVAYYGLYDNPQERQRVVDIGYRLAQESRFQDFPFTFYLVDMPEPNAFALPGGQVFITRGMLNMGLNDDMLAGLLGHEIGHVILKHGTRMQRRATLLNILSQALLVGVMIGASQSDDRPSTPYDPYGGGSNTGDLIQGTAAAGAVVSELLLRSYSRNFEDESDDEGQRLAAAAGFDPDGTRQLMDKMRTHMPQSKEYGYWRTHPFFEERVQAASVREDLLKIQEPKSAAEYRMRTQAALLDYLQEPKLDPDFVSLLKKEALLAWPQGPAADQIRLEDLHALRDHVLEERPMSQEWRDVISVYDANLEEVRELTPDSPLLETIAAEIEEFEGRLESSYPKATEILEQGIYETDFLETFASNYPEASEMPQVCLALGNAFARLGRQEEAVAHFLQTWELAPSSPDGQKALEGLRNLAPTLSSLGALEQLARQADDPELQQVASQRLNKLAEEYDDLANGAEYLKRYPDGQEAQIVAARLNQLADELYGELILYQSVGDHVKGIERIQQILTYAPHSPAAERLRERIVLEG